MTGKQTSCNTKTFQVFFKKAANLNTFSGVIYSREKLDLSRHRKCLRNGSETAIYNQNFRYSPASVSGKGDTSRETQMPQRSSRCLVRIFGVACLWMLQWKNNSSRGELWNFQISTGIYQCVSVLVGETRGHFLRTGTARGSWSDSCLK